MVEKFGGKYAKCAISTIKWDFERSLILSDMSLLNPRVFSLPNFEFASI